MSRFSRRLFLQRSSLGVAAAGLAATVPGLSVLTSSASQDAPDVEGEAADLTTAATTGQLVAHVTDLSTGDISFYSGFTEVVYRDPALASQLLQAAKAATPAAG